MQDQKSTIKPKKKNFNVLSFFSGAMGLDIGLHNAGFETLLTCEIDKASRQTILANNPEIGLIGDIRAYTTEEILEYAGLKSKEEVDLIVGGPPCQAFSSAGKRMGLADDRGNVFLKFIEVIENISPKFAVIENVRGLLSAAYDIDLKPEEEEFLPYELKELKGATMFYVYNRLRAAGYQLSFNLYNSANYGTPQVRERVIIICSRVNEKVPYLKPTHSQNGDFGLPKWNTLKNAIGNLNGSNTEFIKFPEKRLKYYRMLNAGQNWRDLSEEMQKEALGKSYHLGGGKTGFFRRLNWDKPSPTLVTHPAMPATDLGHPEEDRPLSVQEYKRIQEFPDTWEIQGSLINKYKQIGNAVPVSVGEAIGRLILELNEGKVSENLPNFKYSRYLKTADQEFIQDFLSRSRKLIEEKEVNQLSLFS
ncbi:DNA cytosine methyltransferase [uncultured Marivirga sp.]|uniref:DNA cytosine methyltransferase n=1 Tax=uncultured Marivirga sp. TaxID=1123707 RepID=UPI0030ED0B64|tara:strand:+ start:4624 stop:5883 length:1260 start_codon:yes stop_codon:yes gene_type:complete